MCGLCGALDLGAGPVTREELERMNRTMWRRGPDDRGLFVDGRAGLAHRRLSILDLSGGCQPLATEDGRVQVVHNGEIYNFVELRAELSRLGHRFQTGADSEVIVHGYREWGDEVVSRLRGMFALAVWDTERGRMLLARDRFGQKPLAWMRRQGRFVFASTLTALLQHEACPTSIDPVSLAQYLAFEFVPAPRSMLAGVRKLRPAHLLTVERDGTLRERRYFQLPVGGSSAVTADRVDAEIRHRLRESVRRRLVADVPVGVALSGGLDSSSVAAMAAELSSGPIQTFFVGFEEPGFDEAPQAREVAAHLGSEHFEVILGEAEMREIVPRLGEVLDEPLADSSLLPTYLLSRLARRHVGVLLGGDGGDELFAGYPTYPVHRALSHVQPLLRPRLVRFARGLAGTLPVSHAYLSLDFKLKAALAGLDIEPAARGYVWNGGFHPSRLQAVLGTHVDLEQVLAPIRDAYLGARAETHVERVLAADVELNLAQRILVKVDRASMANSLELRAPLLDMGLARYVASLPMSEKLRGWTGKRCLRRAMRGYLPTSVLRRRKKGFGAPVGAWLRGPLASLARELLLGRGGLAESGLVDHALVKSLLTQHSCGAVDQRKRIWPLLVLELWRRAHPRLA